MGQAEELKRLDARIESKGLTARVGAVIVFYQPVDACIVNANRLLAAGLHVVVVDNTPMSAGADSSLLSNLESNIEVISNRNNFGIAQALNQGIEVLLSRGFDWALLFDQDSVPSTALLHQLPAAAERLAVEDRRVALVGPAYHDARLGEAAPFIRFRMFKAKRIHSVGGVPVDVDFLITSGSCVNLRCWRQIGPMDEGLFIDSVDLEWCIRARARGYRLLGIPGITMPHALGGTPVNVFGMAYPTHSPLRHYYMCRNAIALCLRGYVPWTWKSIELIKMPLRLAIYGLFFRPRSAHVTMALKGIWHGLIGRMGKADLSP